MSVNNALANEFAQLLIEAIVNTEKNLLQGKSRSEALQPIRDVYLVVELKLDELGASSQDRKEFAEIISRFFSNQIRNLNKSTYETGELLKEADNQGAINHDVLISQLIADLEAKK